MRINLSSACYILFYRDYKILDLRLLPESRYRPDSIRNLQVTIFILISRVHQIFEFTLLNISFLFTFVCISSVNGLNLVGLENKATFHVFFRYNFLTKYYKFHFSYIMNNIRFIEFAYDKIKWLPSSKWLSETIKTHTAKSWIEDFFRNHITARLDL
jgi:hypothetical protein